MKTKIAFKRPRSIFRRKHCPKNAKSYVKKNATKPENLMIVKIFGISPMNDLQKTGFTWHTHITMRWRFIQMMNGNIVVVKTNDVMNIIFFLCTLHSAHTHFFLLSSDLSRSSKILWLKCVNAKQMDGKPIELLFKKVLCVDCAENNGCD